MGYRLHYAQHFEPDWQGGFFGSRSDEFANLVLEEFEEDYWMNDGENEIELGRTDIKKYIAKLLETPKEANKHFPASGDKISLLNEDVAEAFMQFLKSDDDTIHMEWF